MVCVDFIFQLRQSLDMPIVDFLEIVAFELLSLRRLGTVYAHLGFFPFTPFVHGCKKLISSHQ